MKHLIYFGTGHHLHVCQHQSTLKAHPQPLSPQAQRASGAVQLAGAHGRVADLRVLRAGAAEAEAAKKEIRGPRD